MQRRELPTKPHACADCANPAVGLIEVGPVMLWLCTQCLVELSLLTEDMCHDLVPDAPTGGG